jgi:GNAT superfamily N-acetyltransferase
MDALPLGSREKSGNIPYKYVSALKLAQFGVDRRFQRRGLGREVIADVVELARQAAARYGCRYLTLAAQPDLVRWYASHGFQVNKLHQRQRIEAASTREPADIPVSMRLDLRGL